MSDFEHVPEEFRGKVAKDLLDHLIPGTNQWDNERFDSLSDYQRHLYALFLRLSGISEAQVFAKVFVLCKNVEDNKKESYVNDVIYSAIVGFRRKDGSLIPIPNQELMEVYHG